MKFVGVTIATSTSTTKLNGKSKPVSKDSENMNLISAEEGLVSLDDVDAPQITITSSTDKKENEENPLVANENPESLFIDLEQHEHPLSTKDNSISPPVDRSEALDDFEDESGHLASIQEDAAAEEEAEQNLVDLIIAPEVDADTTTKEEPVCPLNDGQEEKFDKNKSSLSLLDEIYEEHQKQQQLKDSQSNLAEPSQPQKQDQPLEQQLLNQEEQQGQLQPQEQQQKPEKPQQPQQQQQHEPEQKEQQHQPQQPQKQDQQETPQLQQVQQQEQPQPQQEQQVKQHPQQSQEAEGQEQPQQPQQREQPQPQQVKQQLQQPKQPQQPEEPQQIPQEQQQEQEQQENNNNISKPINKLENNEPLEDVLSNTNNEKVNPVTKENNLLVNNET